MGFDADHSDTGVAGGLFGVFQEEPLHWRSIDTKPEDMAWVEKSVNVLIIRPFRQECRRPNLGRELSKEGSGSRINRADRQHLQDTAIRKQLLTLRI